MGFGFEIELRRRAPAPHLDIVFGALADGNGLVRHIRHRREHAAKPLVEFLDPLVEAGHPFAHRAHALLRFAGIDALSLQLRDFLAGGVSLRLQLLGFGDGGAAFAIEGAEGLRVERVAAVRQAVWQWA